MKKIVVSFLYVILHPKRAVQIFRLYRLLMEKYKVIIILSQTCREAFYRKEQWNGISLRTIAPMHKEEGFDGQRVMVNINDGLLHSVGLTDRLIGISTSYNFVKMHNFKF